MMLRVLYLIALIGIVGGDSRGSAVREDEDARVGGEGFGNVVMLAVMIGAVLLIGIVVLAILSLSGQFSSDVLDPRT